MAVVTYYLTATADAYVDAAAPNTNYGTGSTLECGYEGTYYTPSYHRRIFIKFDGGTWAGLTYEQRMKVSRANPRVYATFYVNDYNASTRQYIRMVPVLGDWSETGIKWNNQPEAGWGSPLAEGFINKTGWNEANWDLYAKNIFVASPPYSVAIGPSLPMWESGTRAIGNAIIRSRNTPDYSPTLVIEYTEPVPLNAWVSSPIGEINIAAPQEFRWGFTPGASELPGGYTLQYRKVGATTWQEVTGTGTEMKHVFPANTFEVGEYEWRVKVTNEFGQDSPWSSVRTFAGIDYPYPPKNLEPNGGTVDTSFPATFRWQMSGAGVEAQASYTLDYKNELDAGWTTVTGSGTATQHTFGPDTLPGGVLQWRVKVVNEYGQESGYSEIAEVYAIGSPPAPTVSVAISTRPTITWTAAEQKAWQLQILRDNEVIYDPGENFSAKESRHDVGMYLDDGLYIARVRVRSAYGFWSAWGEKEFGVSTTKPDAGTIDAVDVYKSGLRLICHYNTPKAIIYRKDTGKYRAVATLEGATEWVDYTVASGVRYTYFLRSVAADGAFMDSEPVLGWVDLSATFIAPADRPCDMVPFKLRYSADKARNTVFTSHKQLVYYRGRQYPVVEDENRREYGLTVEYAIGADYLDAFYKLVEEPIVLYRDPKGAVFYGTISGVQVSEMLKGYNVSFTIHRVNRPEVEEYA